MTIIDSLSVYYLKFKHTKFTRKKTCDRHTYIQTCIQTDRQTEREREAIKRVKRESADGPNRTKKSELLRYESAFALNQQTMIVNRAG